MGGVGLPSWAKRLKIHFDNKDRGIITESSDKEEIDTEVKDDPGIELNSELAETQVVSPHEVDDFDALISFTTNITDTICSIGMEVYLLTR